MVHLRSRIAGVTASLAVQFVSARSVTAQQGVTIPPIRQLGPRLAASTDSLGSVAGLRQLSDGRVMVNDGVKHQLLIFDAGLSHSIVIADSTATTKKAYGSATGGLVAYRGDTTLFVDPVALSMSVIDPHGVIVRTVAPPRPGDAPALISPTGSVALDAGGRIVYRYVRQLCTPSGICQRSVNAAPEAAVKPASLPVYALHDSMAIIRGDIATHGIDTAGFIALPTASRILKTERSPDGTIVTTQTIPSPIPVADDWAVVSDGSVAFVRGQDYHVDWVNADGTRSSTPKIAHDWRRLSDSEKTEIIDSTKRFVDSLFDAMLMRASKAGGQKQSVTFIWPELSDLPDYRPVITEQGVVRADMDDDLWIRQGGSSYLLPGGGSALVYDIVNRQGRLVDRVQLPPTLSLAGFGPGVVYLTSREGWGTVILKYRIR